MKKVKKYAKYGALSIVIILVSGLLLVHSQFFQNQVKKTAVSFLKDDYNIHVDIERLDFSLFSGTVKLQGIHLHQPDGSSLLNLQQLQGNLSLLRLIKREIYLESVGLSGLHAQIEQGRDSIWNYDFLAESFMDKSDSLEVEEDSLAPSMPVRIGTIQMDDVLLTYYTALTQDSMLASFDHFSTNLLGSNILDSIRLDTTVLDGLRLVSAISADTGKPDELRPEEPSEGLPVIHSNGMKLTNMSLSYSNQEDLKVKATIASIRIGLTGLDLNTAQYTVEGFQMVKPEILLDQTNALRSDSGSKSSSATASETLKFEMPELSLLLSNFNIAEGACRYVVREGSEQKEETISVGNFNLSLPLLMLDTSQLEFNLANLSANSSLFPEMLGMKAEGQLSETGTSVRELSLYYGESFVSTGLVAPGIIGKFFDSTLFKEVSARFTVKDSKIFPSEVIGALGAGNPTSRIPDEVLKTPLVVGAVFVLEKNALTCENLTVNQAEVFASAMSGTVRGIFSPSDLVVDDWVHSINLKPGGLNAVNALGAGIAHLRSRMEFTSEWNGNLSKLEVRSTLLADQNEVFLKGSFNPDEEEYTMDGTLKLHDYTNENYQKDLPNKIDGTVFLKGKGFDPETARMQYAVFLKKFFWNGHNYEKLDSKGALDHGDFNGTFALDDSHIKMNLSVSASEITKTPHIVVQGGVERAHLKTLDLSDQIYDLRLAIQADVTGSEADQMNGHVSLNKIFFQARDTSFSSEKISITSSYKDSISRIDIDSRRLNIHYSGNEPLLLFANEISNTIMGHIPGSTEENLATGLMKGEGKLSVQVKDVSGIIAVFVPELTEMEDLELEVSYGGLEGVVNSKVSMAKIAYQGISCEHPSIALACTKEALYAGFHDDSLTYSDYTLPHTTLAINITGDTIKTGITIGNSEKNPDFRLVSDLYLNPSEQWVLALPSGKQIIGSNDWQVNKDNFLTLTNGPGFGGKIELVQNNTLVRISGNKDQHDYSNIQLYLSGLELGKMLPLLSDDYREINGVFGAQLTLADVFGTPDLKANVLLNHLSYGKDTICDMEASVYQNSQQDYLAQMKATGQSVNLNLEARYDLDSGTIFSVLNVNELNVRQARPFLADVADTLKGYVSGKVHITGEIAQPQINGDLQLHEIYIHSVMTNTSYSIKHGKMQIEENQLYLRNLKIKDAWDKTASINGNLDFRNTDAVHYLFNVKLDHFTLLNTTGEDPELAYFGLLKSSSEIEIHEGAEKSVIDGVIKIDEESELQMRWLEDRDYNRHEGLVRFVRKDTLIDVEKLVVVKAAQRMNQSLVINTRLLMDPKATLRIIMDPVAGDYLLVSGEGNMVFRTEKNGVMTLNGSYEVTDGLYRLSFYKLVEKKFSIVPGSTLKWTGDPYNPTSDITCMYQIKTSPKPLLHGDNDQVSGSRLPFNVFLKISGKVMKPVIGYDIKLDDGTSSPDRASIETALDLVRRQEDEQTKQVFSLLTLGKFTARESGESSSKLNRSAYKSVSDMLSNQLNNLSQKYIKDFNVDMDVELAESSTNTQPSASVSLNFQKGFLDNKIVVAAGGDFSDPNGQKSNDLSTDINVTYRLSEDGRLNLTVYRKGTYEGEIEGDVIKTGVTLIFLKNYDKFKDLLKKNKEKG